MATPSPQLPASGASPLPACGVRTRLRYLPRGLPDPQFSDLLKHCLE